MAGAVSAGAYTAGVIDYLIEALDEWEKRKKSGEKNVPQHQVEIPVIGGASAGGITGILLASKMNNPIQPLQKLSGNLNDLQPTNPFFNLWVDLTGDDMLARLLQTDDLDDGKVKSLINSQFIEEKALEALHADAQNWLQRSYLPDEVKLFVTLTNTTGFDYEILFEDDDHQQGSYRMKTHADTATFMVNREKYEGDGWIPLSFKTRENLNIAQNAAMSTSAFPIGLMARKLKRKKEFVYDNIWLKDFFNQNKTDPLKDEYESLNIDGGTINNEPFEKVRELLCKQTGEKDADFNSHKTFRSTMLMIDPFPGDEKKQNCQSESQEQNAFSLQKLIPSILSTMLNQLRAKPTELRDAMSKEKAGAYLIAPCRFVKTNGQEDRIRGEKALASGALGGFSGFLNKEFRIHDFFLGRANCERFLSEHFTIPKDCSNEIFREGYAGVADLKKFQNSKGELQIIPVFSEPKDQMYMPVFSNGKNWPTLPDNYLKPYTKAVVKRVKKIVKILAKDSGFLPKLYLNIGLLLGGKKIGNGLIDQIKDKLKCHKLIEN